MTTICSYCKRIQNPDTEEWEDNPEPDKIISLADDYTDCICPECQKEIDEIIDALPNIIKSNN